MKATIRAAASALLAVVAGVSWYLWHELHFRLRGCFSGNGLCFLEEDAVTVSQAGGAWWIVPALLATAGSLYFLLRLWRS